MAATPCLWTHSSHLLPPTDLPATHRCCRVLGILSLCCSVASCHACSLQQLPGTASFPQLALTSPTVPSRPAQSAARRCFHPHAHVLPKPAPRHPPNHAPPLASQAVSTCLHAASVLMQTTFSASPPHLHPQRPAPLVLSSSHPPGLQAAPSAPGGHPPSPLAPPRIPAHRSAL